MAPRKKAETVEAQGILSLINKPVKFIDCRSEQAGQGILRTVDSLGWVGIEINGALVFFYGSKLDALTENKEQTAE